MPYWEEDTITRRIDKMVYIIQGPRHTHKRHINQIKKRHEIDSNSTQDEVEEPIEIIYDTFDLEPPQHTPEQRRSGRKRKFTDHLTINSKKKRY